ncbi:MAG: hypothetical protein ACK5MP_10485 [Nostocoides sp.]
MTDTLRRGDMAPPSDLAGVSDRALEPIGGPRGRRATAATWATRVWPLVLLAVIPVQLSLLQKAWCLDHGWTNQTQFWRACFSDLPGQAQGGGLWQGFSAYVTGLAGVDQPVVTGAVMAAVGDLVPAGTLVQQQRGYVLWFAVLTAVLVIIMTMMVAAALPAHPGRAAQVALSPVVFLTALVSADIVGVALCTAGIWAWARRRPVLAGALLGVAVLARTYPVMVLVALVLLAVRTGRWSQVGRTLIAAGAAMAAIVIPFLVVNPPAVTAAYAAWWRLDAGFGSPWLIPQLLATASTADSAPPGINEIMSVLRSVFGQALPIGVVTGLAVFGMLLALVLGALLALGAPRRPTLAQLALFMTAIVLVTGKSFPVQASLWLVPLVALAGLRWRDHLIWAGTEAVHFVAVWLYIGGLSRPDRGLPPAWYAVFLLVRILGVLYVAWRVWRTAYAADRHRLDPSWPTDPEADAVIDETAGDFENAPDRVVAQFTR